MLSGQGLCRRHVVSEMGCRADGCRAVGCADDADQARVMASPLSQAVAGIADACRKCPLPDAPRDFSGFDDGHDQSPLLGKKDRDFPSEPDDMATDATKNKRLLPGPLDLDASGKDAQAFILRPPDLDMTARY